jgi:hypothetical protein
LKQLKQFQKLLVEFWKNEISKDIESIEWLDEFSDPSGI